MRLPPQEMAITMMNLRGCICSRPKATDMTSTATEVNALSLRRTCDQSICRLERRDPLAHAHLDKRDTQTQICSIVKNE